MNENHDEITRLTVLIQSLINCLREREPENEVFEQSGILDGQVIVDGFVVHNEAGLAIEHLLYMVYESDIAVPANELRNIDLMAKKFGVNNCYVGKNA